MRAGVARAPAGAARLVETGERVLDERHGNPARPAFRQHDAQILAAGVDVEGRLAPRAAIEHVGDGTAADFQHVGAAGGVGKQIHQARWIDLDLAT